MVDEKRVIIMSKLAVLDKNNIKKDLKITNYYPEDYVYMNNLKTRISMLIIVAMGALIHIMFQLEKNIVIPTTGVELFNTYILPYGGVAMLVLVFYTILSTKVYKRRYATASKRVETYRDLLKELDQLDKVEAEERGKHDGKRRTTYSKNTDCEVL